MRIAKLTHKSTTTGRQRKSPRYHVEFTDHHAPKKRGTPTGHPYRTL